MTKLVGELNIVSRYSTSHTSSICADGFFNFHLRVCVTEGGMGGGGVQKSRLPLGTKKQSTTVAITNDGVWDRWGSLIYIRVWV